jgi:hypothetical protein
MSVAGDMLRCTWTTEGEEKDKFRRMVALHGGILDWPHLCAIH